MSSNLNPNEAIRQGDNVRPHTSAAVKDIMAQRNITVPFQSPYSPDFRATGSSLIEWKIDFEKRVFNDHANMYDLRVMT